MSEQKSGITAGFAKFASKKFISLAATLWALGWMTNLSATYFANDVSQAVPVFCSIAGAIGFAGGMYFLADAIQNYHRSEGKE